jgi:FKBP-type peptidyl-prolyl cis-trans isomerase
MLSALAGHVAAQEAEPVQAPAEPAAAAEAAPPAAPSHGDISYAVGYSIGSRMIAEGADFDIDQLANGIRAGFGEGEARLSGEEMELCLFTFQMQMQQQALAQVQENLDRANAFLAENATKEGVTVTESGLQYRVISSGDGPMPTIDDVVRASYRGTLIDGTEFDRSPEGEPITFPVSRVIPGWTEALQLMKVGDKWELFIPPALGYGERGSQGAIGPNEALIFEVELVGIGE